MSAFVAEIYDVNHLGSFSQMVNKIGFQKARLRLHNNLVGVEYHIIKLSILL